MLQTDSFNFLTCFLKSPRSIGSITPSSSFLSRKVSAIDSSRPVTAIELGPGSGPITRQLKLKADDVICYEKNPALSKRLVDRHPGITVRTEDAMNCVGEIASLRKANRACNIVSSLPLTIMEKRYVLELIEKIASGLESRECFLCFFYIPSILMPPNRWIIEALQKRFTNIVFSVEFLNIPPALVVKCTK